MPWPLSRSAPHNFMNSNWIHPQKQAAVCLLVDYVRESCPDVSAIIVFGSAVHYRCRGDESDVDILVNGHPRDLHLPHYDNWDIGFYQSVRNSPLWDEICEEGVIVFDREGECLSEQSTDKA